AIREQLRGLEMANSREDDFFRRLHHGWICRYAGLAPQALPRLHHRRQISRLVIDDRDHSNPLVLGSISPNCLSREQATRSARANALNRASTLWWLDRPYMVTRWTLARAPRANPSKKSSTNSLCMSPTRRFLTLVFTLQATRPL